MHSSRRTLKPSISRWLLLFGLIGLVLMMCGGTIWAILSVINKPQTVDDNPLLQITLPAIISRDDSETPEAGELIPTAIEQQVDEEIPVINYPYISGINEHSKEIFRLGQLYGNRSNAFAKVGDSITATEAFLVPIGRGDYELHDHVELASVIGYFSTIYVGGTTNSFERQSVAAVGGWRADQVLLPGYSRSPSCLPDETPLLCEYRIVRPSVALIMLGTNDVLVTNNAKYEATLREIIERTENLGIIPVISTIPSFRGMDTRVIELNSIIVRLAREYDIPLWDYYAATVDLPNNGLSNDGVHPSFGGSAIFTEENLQRGMAVRNLTALQALDAIFRQVILPEMQN